MYDTHAKELFELNDRKYHLAVQTHLFIGLFSDLIYIRSVAALPCRSNVQPVWNLNCFFHVIGDLQIYVDYSIMIFDCIMV